jgi:hypothetical protein
MRTLAVAGEPAAVAEAAVAAQVHQALDVHLNFAAKIALDLVVGLEELSDLLDIVLGELLGLLRRRNARALADLERERLAHAVEVGERIPDVLVTRKVDACDTSHVTIISERTPAAFLALPLLVARVLANDADDALAPDDLALVANLFD